MQIDPTTMADLEVMAARDGGPGILGLVDRTRTRRGRQALSRRLRQPLTTVREIRDVQAALAALRGMQPLRLPGDDLLDEVEGYVRSNIVVSRADRRRARMDELWMRLRYPRALRELRDGQAALGGLMDRVEALLPGLSGPQAPPLLRTFAQRLDSVRAEVTQALGDGPLLSADGRIRGELRDGILDVVRIVGELDALRSMAMAGEAHGWTTPELVDSEDFLLEARGAYHPFLQGATPNPIQLNGGEPLVFLTGPNMAGKTTYLKTVAVLALLAQTGMDVPASSARLAPVEVLFTSLNPTDNLRQGISYFYAEVLRVREAAVILAQGRRALVLFDEVFKGTNVKDALEASAQVIGGFARTRRSGSIFASHLSELHEKLRTTPSIRFCRFDGEVVDGSPVFDYALASGVSDKRFGLLLLRKAQVTDLIARIGT